MRQRLPPLSQIEAFVVAARAPTFRVASERCALSPAAFSRRIQAFSAFIGAELFEHGTGGARLTEAGRKCLEDLEPAYLELIRATASIGYGCSRNQEVKLSLSHGLAVGWLVPRLGGLRAAHPEIELSFKIQRGAADLRRGEVDLAICFSDIELAGLESQPLLDVTCTPLAAPAIAQIFKTEGGRLEQQRLLAVDIPSDIWQWWARSTGTAADLVPTTRFDMLHTMYETASQGFGITLGSSPTVWPHFQSGRLERLDLPAARYPGGYHLAVRADRKRKSPVATVWRWLVAEGQLTPSFL